MRIGQRAQEKEGGGTGEDFCYQREQCDIEIVDDNLQIYIYSLYNLEL